MSKHSWPDEEPMPSVAEPTSTAEEPTAVEEPADAAEPVAAEEAAAQEAVAEDETPAPESKPKGDRGRVLAFVVLPAVALLLAGAAGYLKWQDNSVRNAQQAGREAVQAAKDATVAMLSYTPDNVDTQFNDAKNRLTGEFLDTYTLTTNDIIIPNAKAQQISAVASVPAAAPVSADLDEAVVLLFVNQTVAVGQAPPTDNTMRVQATLERSGDRWLISKYEPV